MLRDTTKRLAITLFRSSVVAFILSFIIVLLLGAIGTSSSANSTATQSGSVSSSVSSSSTINQNAAVSSGLTATQQSNNSDGGLLAHTSGKVFVGIICILIYIALLYVTAWHEGSKDPNRVNYGHMNKFMAKGLVAGLFASIPYAVLLLTFIISRLFYAQATSTTIITAVFRVVNIQFVLLSDSIINNPVLCFLYLLPLPIISCVGYIMGYNRIVLTSKIIYKNSKKSSGSERKITSNMKR